MEQWTEEDAIAYECACDAISDLMSIKTRQIADESRKSHPDPVRLESLRTERSRLARERKGLYVNDHAQVARIRSEYGKIVRNWRFGNLAVS
ncbi:hypothetical protein [Verminephrobacter aporrectodeae]|uniref:hypothetical protein n=1 Tax=Verminephrobacter aporrectodeae TaxID=1110389 RepID=UPI0002DEEAAB|nr:hypothetical protein [Verminephrobacter aporrectodeae]